jgi:MFS family permease
VPLQVLFGASTEWGCSRTGPAGAVYLQPRHATRTPVKNDGRPSFNLPRPVWLLGWVSFFTDMATEMTYPLLPVFLTRVIGAGAMSLGIIEGVADAANSVLKIASGWVADRTGAPKPLVVAGYSISSAVRPLIAIVGTWPQVLAIRFADRMGKGIRGAPRDAMLATFSDPSTRGRVYGFHRAMDHAGAVVGPLIASAFLFFYPGEYRTLFALTIVPGIIVIIVLLRVPAATAARVEAPPAAPVPYARSVKLPKSFWKAMAIIFVFTLGNASDAFLLLRLTDLGIAVFWIPLLWSALHVVKSAASVGGGELSDRLGRRTLIGLGWIVFALVYFGFAIFDTPMAVVVIFLSYGLFFGLTEGVEKAWIADLAPAPARGTAFGIYNGMLGLGSLVASVLFGLLWTRVSPQAAFMAGAGLAVAATALLYLLFSYEENPDHQR